MGPVLNGRPSYSIGQIVPVRGAGPADPAVPADAVTASGSGLDPHISPAYADLQVNRVAKARARGEHLARLMTGWLPSSTRSPSRRI